MEIIEILLPKIIEIVIIAIAAVVGRYAIPFLRTHINYKQLTLALQYALAYVEAAEKIINGKGMGEEKLALVSAQLETKLKDLKVNMNADDIRALIEQAVNIMNDQAE